MGNSGRIDKIRICSQLAAKLAKLVSETANTVNATLSRLMPIPGRMTRLAASRLAPYE